ncbi:MAG: OsmC family protein [Candidatus Omnitrophica bacterium]|nr:OsmC family protein [Candidatus Omnitrophota bacterium]
MYQVEVIHVKDLAFEVKSGEESFVIDAKGKGLTPLDALLSGLGSCVGVYIRKYAESSNLGLEKFKVSVEAELTKESPFMFKIISVSVDLNGVGLDERRKNALSEFIKNCPVHNTLKGNPQIQVKIL